MEVPGSSKGFQTEVVENSSDPVWKKSGKLVLAPEEEVLFKVMDRDDGDADDLLGKVSLPVAKLLPDGFEGKLEMQETGKATAFLSVRSKVLRALYDAAAVADALKASQSQPKRPPPPKPPKVHEIEVTVKAAKGLRNADWSFGGSGGSDAYVAVSVPGTKKEFQTPVVEDSSDPTWNFAQKLSVAPKETLVFKVFDRDRRNDELLGTASLAISGILPQGFSGALKLEDARNPTTAELLVSVRVLQNTGGKETGRPRVLAYSVEMTVMSATGLRNADWSLASSGGSDAYCLVEVPGSSKGFQTEVVENSSDPVWKKSGKLVLAPGEEVLFKVMDRDDGDADDLLGKVSLPVAKLLPDGFEGKLEMQETGKATAFLSVRSKVLRALYDAAAVADALKASQSQPKRPPPPKPPKVHEIEVTVKAAKGLRNADWSFGGSGGSDAYVAVSVPGTKKEFQTPVVEDSSDPTWNFAQKLSVAPKETLVFKVFDRDRRNDELLGTASLAISGILPQGFSGALKLEDARNPTTAELLVSVRVLQNTGGKETGLPRVLAYSVEMTVMSATGLRNADWSLASSGGSDAYCLVEVPGSSKGFQTEVVENSSDPVWKKSGKLVLAPEEEVLFKVMDRDDGDADDLLGKVSLPVAKLLPDGFEGKLEMQETGKAIAFLSVRSKVLRALYDASAVADALKASQSQPKRPPPPKPPKVHEIEVTVKAAKGLRNADWSFGGSGGSDAYVAVSVPGTKKEFQTPVVEDSSDPKWNFAQKLSVAPKETLVFKVFDRDRRNDELLGTASLAISGILPQGFSGALKLEDARNPTTAELLVSVRVLQNTGGKETGRPRVLAYSVEMTVMSATGLRNADWSLASSGGSDAYCLVEVPGSSKGFQTEVVENSSDPVWKKSGKLVLAPEEEVLFKVMDRDDGDADDLLGKVSLPVAKLLPDGFEGKLEMQETGKAIAFLSVRSKVLRALYDAAAVADALKASQSQPKRPPPPKPPKVHEIEVTVKAAKGLRNADWSFGGSGGSDAYVAVSVPGTKKEFQTPVVEDSSDPKWNFAQKLSVAPKETLVFKVFDRDRRNDELLGTASLAISGILPQGFSGALKLEDARNPTTAELLVSVRVLQSSVKS